MQIIIEEIKKNIENKDFFKSIFFKKIKEIIKDYNKNFGNKYYEKDFFEFVFTKKTIQKYEKELLIIFNFIFKNYNDGFFVAVKNKNSLFFTNKNQFAINGYDNFNLKLSYETSLTFA